MVDTMSSRCVHINIRTVHRTARRRHAISQENRILSMIRATLSLLVAACVVLSGCSVSSRVNLAEVAREASLTNVTTGDGTFEDYKATGFYSATEIGIGVGIFTVKLVELHPKMSPEALLTEVAKSANADSADALININPSDSRFVPLFPIPLVAGIGLYVDAASGTGINVE